MSDGGDRQREVDVNREELFLKKLREIKSGYLLWNKETLLMYSKKIYSLHPEFYTVQVRNGYKALEGIDLGVGGIVKHLSYSSLKKFIDIKQPKCDVGRFLYGKYYKGIVDYNGREKTVTIKNWELYSPGRDYFALYPSMLYNDITITRCDRLKSRPNVARLIGYSIDKILASVYDLRPKCTLYEAIFGTNDFDWKYRVRAAVGVGRAIESFHEDGIVVGCIDANWMFLDEDSNVYLCDFSLQPNVKAMIPETKLSLLPWCYEGYGRDAPECGRYTIEGCYDPERKKDYATLERDIYSYGILLLDLISKQKFSDLCFHLWTETKTQDELSDLVHKSFPEVEDSEAKKITSLAVSCLSVDPLKRPKIKDVVRSFESLTKDHFGHRDKILKT